jgi:hypothetical protein
MGGTNYASKESSEKDNSEKDNSEKSNEEVRQLSVCARHCRLVLSAQTDMLLLPNPRSQSPI